MDNAAIRDYFTSTYDATVEKQIMRDSFCDYLSNGRLSTNYEQQAINAGYELHTGVVNKRHQIKTDDTRGPIFAVAPPVAAVCEKIRQAVGPLDYLRDMPDIELVRRILRPLKDRTRKALWAMEARERAANRAGGLPLEKDRHAVSKIDSRVKGGTKPPVI